MIHIVRGRVQKNVRHVGLKEQKSVASGRGKRHTHNRDIFKKDVELFCSVQKVISDPSRNNLSICDQLRGYIRARSLVKDHLSENMKIAAPSN